MSEEYKAYLRRNFTEEEVQHIISLHTLYTSFFFNIAAPGRIDACYDYANTRKDEFAQKVRKVMKKTKKYAEELNRVYIALGIEIIIK